MHLFLKVVRNSLFCLAVSSLNAATKEDSRAYKIINGMKFETYLTLSELSELIMDPSVQFYHLSCNI